LDVGLRDRVALVAGSSRGIGKAIALGLLREGCRTCVSGRDPVDLSQTAAEFEKEFGPDRVMQFAGDLTKTEMITRAIEQIRGAWGPLHCVVANVGSGRGKAGWSLDEDEWERLFRLNLWGSVRLVEAAIPLLIEGGRGSVVLIASIAGVEVTPAPLPYSAAKAALINYGKNLSRLVASRGVRVNSVAPGNILFPGGSWEKHLAERRDEVIRYIETEVAMRRFGGAEEIGNLVVFLCSEKASFITGACIVADGGQTRCV
jgi:3-oxoacyl-[acyl-carrier protein] reductase